MITLRIAYQYFVWHYTRAFVDLARVWMNIFWFLGDFFSIGLLMRTLFSPWQRMQEHRRKGLDIENFLAVLLVNTIMRLVGFFIRIVVISTGLLAMSGWVALGIAGLFAWIAVPVGLILLLSVGVHWIMSGAY